VHISLTSRVEKLYNDARKSNWIDHILPRNCLLKHFDEVTGRKGEEEDVSRQLMTRKIGDTVNCKRNQYITLSTHIPLEETVDLTQDNLRSG